MRRQRSGGSFGRQKLIGVVRHDRTGEERGNGDTEYYTHGGVWAGSILFISFEHAMSERVANGVENGTGLGGER